MNISSLLNGSASSLAGGSQASSQANATSNSASPFLQVADTRVQTQVDVTTAQISKFGQLKSALSDGQVAANAMTTLSSATTSADATTALANFFNTFNTSIGAANAASVAAGPDSASQNATRLVRDFKSALSTDPAIADAMKKLGLTLQKEGTLVQDPKKFADSMAADPKGTLAAMAKIGSKVNTVTNAELDTGGSVGAALAALNAKSTSLTAEQKALKALEQSMASLSTSDPFTSTDASTQSTASTSFSNAGLAAYQSNMTSY
jgi:hypothetical protein